MTKKIIVLTIAVAVAVGAFVGFVGSSEVEARRPGPSIAEVAVTSSDFNYLVEALTITGLVDTFDGNRQFTVFAPNDEAFMNLLTILEYADLQELVDDKGEDFLKEVLLYHVAPGRRNAAAVTTSNRVNTLNGEFIWVDGTTLNSTINIVDADVEASNGIIHEIDAVLLPPM